MTEAPSLNDLDGPGAVDRILAELAELPEADRLTRVYAVIRAIAGMNSQVRHAYRDAVVGRKYIRRDDWRDAESEARAAIKAAQRAEAEARREALRETQPVDPEGGAEVPPPTEPMAVARHLLADDRVAGHLTMQHWRGSWMRWQRVCWIEVEPDAVKSWAYKQLEHAKYVDVSREFPEIRSWSPNRRRIADLLDALAGVVHLRETIDAPAWLAQPPVLPDGTRIDAEHVVACTNGLLHIGTRTLFGLTPTYFNRVSVPFDHDPQAPEPARWLQFLAEIWPDDADAINALQEYFGYVLSGRTDLQKILLLVGPTRSGKGTIARVLAALVGKGNAAGPTLASLGTNFGLAPLLGKPLAIISDARLGGANVHQVVERLLSVSGEDMLTVDRKYKEPWTGKLPARFVILSNELPRFGDASGAIAHRFIVLTMVTSFLGKEDPTLTRQLYAELPGILNWALDGLDRLTQERVFTEPKSSKDAIRTLQDIVSPISAFVRDWCKVGAEYEVLVDTLYAAWKAWCEANGRDKPGTVQTFGRDLRAVSPGIHMSQPRTEDGGRQRRYAGIALNEGHNGPDRVPPRSTDPAATPQPRLARDGTRDNPLSPSSGEKCAECGEPYESLGHQIKCEGLDWKESGSAHPRNTAPGTAFHRVPPTTVNRKETSAP